MSLRPQVEQPTCRGVAAQNGHVPQLGEGVSESLVQLRHIRGPLLSYLLAPGTGNLHFEEVVTRVLQENWEGH